jgi:hypothetical protein
MNIRHFGDERTTVIVSIMQENHHRKHRHAGRLNMYFGINKPHVTQL